MAVVSERQRTFDLLSVLDDEEFYKLLSVYTLEGLHIFGRNIVDRYTRIRVEKQLARLREERASA